MKHQYEIIGQRIENMKSGVVTTGQHIENVKSMVHNILNVEKENMHVLNAVSEITKELEEIADFLRWVQQQ